ncbi:hypothetical protein ACFLYJ_01570 [Candidatus Cloacimonadota bacterium]
MILFPIIIAVLAAYWFYKKSTPPLVGWRRILLFVLRSISFTIVMIFLFNPILNFIQNKTSYPKIIFLIDVSESMNQTGIEFSKSEVYEQFNEQLKSEFSNMKYEILEYDFAAGLNGKTNSTDFTNTLQEISKKINLSDVHSVYLFSDGWFKDENLDILNEIDVPVNVISPDFSFNDFDLEIADLRHNKSVYMDEIVPIQVNVKADNYKGVAQIELKYNNRIQASKQLNFRTSDFHEIYFENVFKTSGLQNFEVIIQSDSTGEINIENNTFPAAIQVLENRLKCLIVSDKLTWDESFIIAAMQKDEYWETTFISKQDQFKKEKNIVSLRNELIDTNVLILANHNGLKLSRQDAELITRFVASGGSILTYGKPLDSISSIFPAIKSNLSNQFSSQLFFTEESRKYQTFRFEKQNISSEIPPVDYYYVNPKIQSQILAKMTNDQNSPAILFINYEKGKVIYFAFENLWKWQLRTEDDQYQKFMNNLINWIGRKDSERLIVQSDKNSYFAGETVIISAVAYDEKLIPISDLSAKLSLFDDKNAEIYSEYLLAADQEFSLKIRDLKTGKYHYKVLDDDTDLSTEGEFVVSAFNPESRDKGINAALLAYIAQKTDGEIINSESIETLSIEKAAEIDRELKREIQLYRKWYLIAVFLISFCTELFFRKRWGML